MTPPIKRPRILVTAAKIGLENYHREKGLARLLRMSKTPEPEIALARLSDAEHVLNKDRLEGVATYSIERHIDVLTALLAEMRLTRQKSLPVW